MNSKLLALFALMAASALILGCTSQSSNAGQTGSVVLEKEVPKVKVKLTVSSPESYASKEIEVEKGTNGLQATQKLFDVKYNETAFGVFVQAINGVEPDAGHFWALFVDGNFASQSIDRYVLDKDTEIKWIYLSNEEGMKYFQ